MRNHADHDRVVLHRVAGFFHAIKADNLDLLFKLCSFHSGSGCKSGVIAKAEDTHDIRIGLNDVLCCCQGFRTGDARLDRYDLDVGMICDCLFEAFDAVHDRLNGRIFNHRNIAFVANGCRHQFASLFTASKIVGANKGGDINIVGGHIHCDDLDTRLLRLGNGRADALAVDGRNDDHINALGDEILDIRQLLAQVLIGDGDFQRNALGGRLLLHRLGEGNIEGMLLGE